MADTSRHSSLEHEMRPDFAENAVRCGFWLFGLAAGAVLTYTTRYFVNGDAINYIEMGEALRIGHLWDLVNLTESPGYAVLLGLGQVLLDTTRANELPMLKAVNYVCFVFAMLSCDLLLQFLKQWYFSSQPESGSRLPWSVVSAACYGMFLFSTLNWVRPRLVAPEMMVFSLVLLTVTITVWIAENPRSYFRFVVLGLVVGVSYLYKTFFFPFSLVYFGVAAFAARPLSRALPRVTVSALVMLVVAAPLILSLSIKAGRFSYGEAGNLTRKIYVGGRGQSVNAPVRLSHKPEVLLYRDSPFVNSTRPAAFDPSYWTEGVEPVIDIPKQLRLLGHHVWQALTDCPWLTIGLLVWIGWNRRWGALRLGGASGKGILFTLAGIGLSGILLYSTIHVEMRYVAPFLFLLVTAAALWPRYPSGISSGNLRSAATGLAVLAALFVALTLGSVIDQSIRSENSTGDKPSYREAYYHMVAVKEYLAQRGVAPGADVGVVGFPPVYWGRLANLRIIAEIPRERDMLSATRQERRRAVEALRSVGVETLVAKGTGFARLSEEGWELVPGTRDYYVLIGGPKRTGENLARPTNHI